MKVENGVGAANAFQRKRFDQFFARQNLFTLGRRPAEQRQKISKRRGHKATIAVSRERNNFAMFALWKAWPCSARESAAGARTVAPSRAEGLVEQHLFVRVRQVILTTNDMRDAHLDVIEHHRQVVERMSV